MNSYFKFCPIYDHSKLEHEYSLINLLSNNVTFSRRNNFNDLFDSKVNFIRPSRNRLRLTYKKLSGRDKRHFKELYIGHESASRFDWLLAEMDKILDDYLFYCLTDNPTNNLMWSHYANSHHGFCIEWNGEHIKPDKVSYQDNLPSLDILDFIESAIGLRTKEDLEIQAWKALRTKLTEWEYEREYRFQLGKNSNHLVDKDFGKFALVKFQPEWIKSIIFGYRMPLETRNYIRQNLNANMVYKEIVIAPDKCSLKIQDVR